MYSLSTAYRRHSISPSCALFSQTARRKSQNRAGRTLNIPQKLRSPSSQKVPRKLENVTQPTIMFAQVTELNVNGDLLVD